MTKIFHWKTVESSSEFLGNCKGNKYVTGPNKGWTKAVWNFYLPLTQQRWRMKLMAMMKPMLTLKIMMEICNILGGEANLWHKPASKFSNHSSKLLCWPQTLLGPKQTVEIFCDDDGIMNLPAWLWIRLEKGLKVVFPLFSLSVNICFCGFNNRIFPTMDQHHMNNYRVQCAL